MAAVCTAVVEEMAGVAGFVVGIADDFAVAFGGLAVMLGAAAAVIGTCVCAATEPDDAPNPWLAATAGFGDGLAGVEAAVIVTGGGWTAGLETAAGHVLAAAGTGGKTVPSSARAFPFATRTAITATLARTPATTLFIQLTASCPFCHLNCGNGWYLRQLGLGFIEAFFDETATMDTRFTQALGYLTTGIYVLTVNDEGRHHGMSSSWVTQVSGTPPLFSAAIDNQHFSRSIVVKTGVLGLNIVGSRGKALEDYFYSAKARRPDNLAELAYTLSPQLAVPWLDLAMIAIEARVRDSIVAGDHTILLAEPIGVRTGQGERPLTSLDLDYVYVGGKEVVKRDRSGWT